MKIKKEITFIYQDSAEYAQFKPIAYEAKKRGYIVKWSTDKLVKCEIGFYCQHINFPQFSKFSIIMLHDIIQQYSNWPNLWFRENWNKYDIGILPSKQWVYNWDCCSQWSYARPKKAMFEVGWPKADIISDLKHNSDREEFYKKYGLDQSKRTVLYAPAWENDNKQDDFVTAMLKLDVNIVVKQADMPKDQYPEQYKNIQDMYELHKNNHRVCLLPPSMNIFEAIAVSDILVSEESSTMCEATMMNIPAVSVSDWLIPDVIPSRYPRDDYDFVIKTKKDDLTNCISDILSNYYYYKKNVENYAANMFSNVGNCATLIMDIVDESLNEKPYTLIPLIANKNKRERFSSYIKRNKNNLLNLINYNLRIRYKLVDILWLFAKNIKRRIYQ